MPRHLHDVTQLPVDKGQVARRAWHSPRILPGTRRGPHVHPTGQRLESLCRGGSPPAAALSRVGARAVDAAPRRRPRRAPAGRARRGGGSGRPGRAPRGPGAWAGGGWGRVGACLWGGRRPPAGVVVRGAAVSRLPAEVSV